MAAQETRYITVRYCTGHSWGHSAWVLVVLEITPGSTLKKEMELLRDRIGQECNWSDQYRGTTVEAVLDAYLTEEWLQRQIEAGDKTIRKATAQVTHFRGILEQQYPPKDSDE